MYIACSSTLLCTYTCIQIYVISPTTMVCVSRLPTVNGLYRPSYDGGGPHCSVEQVEGTRRHHATFESLGSRCAVLAGIGTVCSSDSLSLGFVGGFFRLLFLILLP